MGEARRGEMRVLVARRPAVRYDETILKIEIGCSIRSTESRGWRAVQVRKRLSEGRLRDVTMTLITALCGADLSGPHRHSNCRSAVKPPWSIYRLSEAL
jgi:hypothetical protein